MLARLKAAIIVLLVLAWPAPGAAQSCVQSGLAAGDDHTCTFTLGGSAMCWGGNRLGQLGNGAAGAPTQVPVVVLGVAARAIVAGDVHTCAIDGLTLSPVCWGQYSVGQLGDGRSSPTNPDVFSAQAVHVVDPGGIALTGVIALAAGGAHTCALGGGNVQCWGLNNFRQLGDGGTEELRAYANSLASTILDAPAVAISAGEVTNCAVMRDHTARCWGDNSFGQIGTGAATGPVNGPATVMQGNNPLSNVVAIAVGSYHTCAIMNDGTVQCWGENTTGQIGNGVISNAPVLVPTVVVDSSGQPLSGVREIAAESYRTCALMNTGNVQCWGANYSGELGHAVAVGANSASPVAVPITDANGIALPVAHIAFGSEHTCAALVAGGVRCWGNNFKDQLGASTAPNTISATPIAVGGLCNCPGPVMYCNGQCTDTTSDPHNCGGCNSPCTSGTCCSGQCTDTASDPENCGRCNKACLTGQKCVASACHCDSMCGGRCVHLQTDNNNCGSCGHHCRFRPPCNRVESGCETCENGECVSF